MAMVKAENNRLLADIEKLKQRLREEISRTQSDVRLDLNLEKGRMRAESSGQELKITEVDTRIEQEIASLRTAIQASKVRIYPGSYLLHAGPSLNGWLTLHLTSVGYDPSIPRRICYWMFRSINGVSKVPGLTPPTYGQLSVLILRNGGYTVMLLGSEFCDIDVVV